MEVLRKGAKGAAVTQLQQLLGVKQDGVFGDVTLKAVLAFQASRGIGQDGIVGPKTWNELLKTGKGKRPDLPDWVIWDPLGVHVTDMKRKRTIKYIAIHYTESTNSAPGKARSIKHTFETRNGSAEFAVDNRDIVCFSPDPDRYRCWSVGDDNRKGSHGATLYGKATNSNTISIEMCSTNSTRNLESNHEGWSVTHEVLDNTVRLARYLVKKYNIPRERFVRHYDISGKSCPGIKGWNGNELKDKLTGKRTGKLNTSEMWESFVDVVYGDYGVKN